MNLHDKIISVLNLWRMHEEIDPIGILTDIQWRVSSRYQLLYVLTHEIKKHVTAERKRLGLGRCQMSDTLWRDCVNQVYADLIDDYHAMLHQ